MLSIATEIDKLIILKFRLRPLRYMIQISHQRHEPTCNTRFRYLRLSEISDFN